VIDLNGVLLRNRLVTSASLLGYGAAKGRFAILGLSPVAPFVDLRRFGAVTVRTVTTQPRDGHFTLREQWGLGDLGELWHLYRGALQETDAGWLNAFGWSNIGVTRYFEEYFSRTSEQQRILSLGGFSADEFSELVDTVNRRAKPGELAAVEFNVSCHNVDVNFSAIIEEVLRRAVPASRFPVIIKLSPDFDYLEHARLAEANGVAAIAAINTVKGLRLDPASGRPLLKNRYGGLSGRAIKPIGLRVVSELREAGISLPIIAGGGIRSFNDVREYGWAGADACSIGSEVWLKRIWSMPFAPLHALHIRRLIHQVSGWAPATSA
jgi:dihydroorotate dehydrogenase (NAD+) catalytic subunit